MSAMPRLLDLFCGAGGAGVGYERAGFDVVGVDLNAQPSYPFEFHRGDAIKFLIRQGRKFDVVHASPPCQGYSIGTPGRTRESYPVDLIDQVREVCDEYSLPLVIENVPLAERDYRHPELATCGHRAASECVVGCTTVPIGRPITLCGSMFGLKVLRHRTFEVGEMVSPLAHPKHTGSVANGDWVTVAGNGGDNAKGNSSLAAWQQAMDIDWMTTRRELALSIPPAYTEYIGGQVMEWL
jgi:hypothetical protein